MLSLYTTCETNGSTWNFLTVLFPATRVLCLTERSRLREHRAETHQQWGTEWQEISWAFGDNATPPAWHKESLSPKHGLVEKGPKCWFNCFHHLAHVNQNSLNLEGLLHPFQITSRWPWRPWCIWTWPRPPPPATTASQVNARFSVASSSSKNTGD